MTDDPRDPMGPHKDAGKVLNGSGIATILNPKLHEQLQRQLGSVLIAKQGEAMFGGGLEFNSGRTSYKPLSSGEYYRVCCPFCLRRHAVDTKHRLWINHRWGVGLDPDMEFYDPNERFWWMCVCYNEGCLEDPANRKELRNIVYSGIGRELHGERVVIKPGTTTAMSLGVVEFPGYCQRVDELPDMHQACQYLLSRGMDPKQLGPRYDLSYCHEAVTHPIVAGKLIIPVKMDTRMVGWQARPCYDLDDWSGQPKYYNCPRTNRRLMLYGADAARSFPFCVIVEGVTDVWAMGPPAVGLLGKSMSPVQAGLICQNWKAVVLLLDAGTETETTKMHDLLARGTETQVVRVLLPDGLDPASIDREYLFDLIYSASVSQGVDLFAL